MNKDVLKLWIAELKNFSKEPAYKHLRFPMKMESSKGDLFSPEGILCELHSKAFKQKWQPETTEQGKLKDQLSYGGKVDVAPKEVLEWIDITSSQMSNFRLKETFDEYILQLESI